MIWFFLHDALLKYKLFFRLWKCNVNKIYIATPNIDINNWLPRSLKLCNKCDEQCCTCMRHEPKKEVTWWSHKPTFFRDLKLESVCRSKMTSSKAARRRRVCEIGNWSEPNRKRSSLSYYCLSYSIIVVVGFKYMNDSLIRRSLTY